MNAVPAVILGIPIDPCTMTGAIDRVDELIRLGRKYGRAHQVATVNVDFLVNAATQPDVHRLLQHADLNLADGMPVVWASRWFDTPVPQRVAGADLITHLAEASEIRGWRVHLFGAGPGVAERARSMMLERYPSASITADSGPDRIDAESLDEAVAASIRAVDPDVLCVALGNPKQERFIATYRESIPCPVMIGVGGSLDMMVGVRRRAPMWMQRSGTEWIYRAVQEPGRLGRRYIRDIRVFAPSLFAYWRSIRPFRATPPLETTGAHPDLRVGTWAGDRLPEAVVLDFTGADSLNPWTHAAVIGALRESRLQEIPVTVTGVGERLQQCFGSYGTWSLVDRHLGGQPEVIG